MYLLLSPFDSGTVLDIFLSLGVKNNASVCNIY